MGKLARSTISRVPKGIGVIKTTGTVPDTTTYNGGAGFTRDVKSELFLLATQNFVSEGTFYEKADQRDARFVTLVTEATKADPEWTANFLYWLRNEANMRTASIIGAIEYGRATGAEDFGWTLTGSGYEPRAVLDSVLQRADEPAEALGYMLATYGRPTPRWFQRALGDAAKRLYTPFNTLKYDGQGQPIRFGDVIEMSTAKTERDRFKWQMDRKFGRAEGDYGIEMLRQRQFIENIPVERRREWLKSAQRHGELQTLSPTDFATDVLRAAGMTWESVSGWIQGPMDAGVWEAIIPSMGYMALLRNLRNFDEAGVSDKAAQQVMERLTDPEQVKRSKQLPMRFLSAYRAAPSDRWKHSLGVAMDLSLGNVPKLGGRTLILADMSTSMDDSFSQDGQLKRWDVAALFGIAYARAQGETEVVAYSSAQYYHSDPPGTRTKVFTLRKGANVLSEVARWKSEGYFLGGGTDTAGAVRQHYNPSYDRVLLITDEQANRDGDAVFAPVNAKKMTYTFNLAGYRAAHAASSPTRVTIGGLSDKAFGLMSMVEKRQRGLWPWQV